MRPLSAAMRSRRSWKLAALAVPLVVLLTGCRMTQDYVIHADDTVTTTVNMGMTAEESAELAPEQGLDSGQAVCDYIKANQTEDAPDLDYRAYDDEGGMFGCEVTGDQPLSEFEPGSDDSGGITRDGDVFTFRMDNTGSTDEEQAGDGEVWVAVTFPGKVLTHDGGTVSGNTVTWSGDEVVGLLVATGEAKEASSMALIFIIVGAVIVIGVVVVLIIMLTRKKKPAAPSGYPGQYQQQGQYPGQPGQYQQQPGQYGQPQQGQYPGQAQPGQYPQQPGQYPGQPGQYPQQPGQYPGQYPGQPGQYPQQPGQYPQQPGQYPGQPGQYPQQPGQYPGQPQ